MQKRVINKTVLISKGEGPYWSLGGVRFAAAPGTTTSKICAAPLVTTTTPTTGTTMWVFELFAVCSPNHAPCCRESDTPERVRT
jgi:hypothetical protein